MAAVSDVSAYGQLSLATVELNKLASGRSDLVLSASANGASTDADRTTATLVGGVAAPTLTFATVGTHSAQLTKITGVAAPTADNDVATKVYVDGLAAGIDVRGSVALATNAVLDAVNVPTYANGTAGVGATLTEATTTAGALTIDGVALANTDIGKRLLVKNQANAVHNGIYTITNVGNAVAWVLTRATDANNVNNFSPGVFTFVEGGSVNASRGFVATGTSGFVVGTDAINFTQFSDASALTFSHPLVNTLGTVSLTRVAPLGLTGSNQLTVVGTAGATSQGKMLLGSADDTTASAYSDTFGAGASGALALKIEPPTSLPQVVTNVTDAQLLAGGLNIAAGKTLASTDHTPGLVFGSNTARNSTALVASHEGSDVANFRLLARTGTADTWATIAVFTKST